MANTTRGDRRRSSSRRRGRRIGLLDFWQNLLDDTYDFVDDTIDRVRDDDYADLEDEVEDLKEAVMALNSKLDQLLTTQQNANVDVRETLEIPTAAATKAATASTAKTSA